MIEIKNLRRTFDKGKVVAVDNLSFSIQDNEIFGLLGPNGAGKTTTMRMLSTLLKPTSGDILYDGVSIWDKPTDIKRSIGFLTNEIRLDKQFTPNESAWFYGRLYGMTEEEIDENRNLLFEIFGIQEFADRPYGSFSTGMKQKTSLAICLLHDPKIIIFDEPTNGLDVLMQRQIEQYILDAKNKWGKTVIISTHLLDVIERLSDRVGVIIDGKSVFNGTCEEMQTYTGNKSMSDAFVALYAANHTDKR